MPYLPLDHPEPFAATLGVMLYPGDDETDRRKARAFVAHWLAEPIRRLHQAGRTMAYNALLHIAQDAGELLDDLDKRRWGGTTTGNLFVDVFALACTNLDLVSWNNVIKIAAGQAGRNKVKGAQSLLWRERSRFLTVAHLWAAWQLRKGKFSAHPDVGYDGYDDFESFLTEAEILRDFGQSWRPHPNKDKPLLPEDVWRVPDSWQPPARQPGWPETGKIPYLTLPDELIADLRPPGRPRKSA